MKPQKLAELLTVLADSLSEGASRATIEFWLRALARVLTDPETAKRYAFDQPPPKVSTLADVVPPVDALVEAPLEYSRPYRIQGLRTWTNSDE